MMLKTAISVHTRTRHLLLPSALIIAGIFASIEPSQASTILPKNPCSIKDFSQAGVAVSSSFLSSNMLKIETSYYAKNITHGNWWGNISAINLNADGSEASLKWRVIDLLPNGWPNGTSTIPAPASRSIYTYIDSTTSPISFTHSNLVANKLIGSGADQLNSAWTSNHTDYIRGTEIMSGRYTYLFRERTAILGDIVNSTPVLVKDTLPNRYSNWGSASDRSAYTAYRNAKAARANGVIMVGANDGMLHAFREQDGQEIFAYIPRAVLANLHKLLDTTIPVDGLYYVDGPLTEADAYISTPDASARKSTRWSNVVVGTTGMGAKAVFALDVTEVDALRNTDILWEINTSTSNAFDRDLGYINQPVQVGVTVSGEWVAIFGNGFNSSSGRAKLFIVDLATGNLLKTIDTDNSNSNGLGGVRLVRNYSGQIIGAYAGDLQGQMWRFDLSASNRSAWPARAQLLFTAPGTSASGTSVVTTPAITAAPAVTAQAEGRTGYMVTFGTGKLFDAQDIATPYPPQRVYSIWDTASFGGSEPFRTASFAKLASSSISVVNADYYEASVGRALDWSREDGWYSTLTALSGLRVLYPAESIGKLAHIQLMQPSSENCRTTQAAKTIDLFIDPTVGGCRIGKTLDTNGDQKVDSADAKACGFATTAEGINTWFSKTARMNDPDVPVGSAASGSPGGSPSVAAPCTNDTIYAVNNSSKSQTVKICGPSTPPVFQRSFRQVFVRP